MIAKIDFADKFLTLRRISAFDGLTNEDSVILLYFFLVQGRA
jgi:hypothetical protein